jgi:hypothetical protein
MEETMNQQETAVERLAAAAEMLEQAVVRLTAQQSTMTDEVQSRVERIVATVERGITERGITERGMTEHSGDTELELRLARAESQIAELRAQMEAPLRGRRTLPASTASLLSKQGISNVDSIEAGPLDAALSSLSIEQRIAVKSQLLRAGLVG